MTASLTSVILKPPTGLVYDQRSEGWELLEEGPQVQGEPVLDFYALAQEGEIYVTGQTFFSRVQTMEGTETSQYYLERLLDQAGSIPAELRPYKLLATGTRWRSSDGQLYVPCLHWIGSAWALFFYTVDTARWHDIGCVVVRVRK